jgi:hypothetical protein
MRKNIMKHLLNGFVKFKAATWPVCADFLLLNRFVVLSIEVHPVLLRV